MATGARRRLVGPEQRECGLRMVEAREIVPRLRESGNPRTQALYGSPSLRGQCVESSLMRVGMTICATDSCPVILRSGLAV